MKYSNKLAILLAAVLAFLFTLSHSSAEPTSDLSSTIYRTIQTDDRIPSFDDISGSWTLNPDLRGPSYHFTLNQKGTQLDGIGIFSGCLGVRSYRIEGSIHGRKVHLILKEEEKDDEILTFTLVEFRGAVALSRDEVLQEYPMVSYNQRERLKKMVEPNMAVEVNAGQPPPASQANPRRASP